MSVTVQAIPQEPTAASLKSVNEFYVPNILSFNLKKTPEDRLQTPETDGSSSHQNGEIVPEEKEDQKMSPKKKNLRGKQKTSSFLLEPFLKPVGHQLESNKENPVLKALFGGKIPPDLSPWTYVAKNSVNCHPFKKTEFSQDLNSDDTPVQVPQSLTKKALKASEKKEETQESENVLKEVQLKSNFPIDNAPGVIITKASATNIPRLTIKESSDVKKELDLSLFRAKKKVSSDLAFPSKNRNQYINCERLIKLRTIVDNAIKNHKVYSMTGCYSSVRNALKQRGWIEKIDNDVKGRRKVNRFEEIAIYDAAFQFVQKYQTVAAMRSSLQSNSGFSHNDQIRYTGQGEAEIINKMLRNVTEDLCWLSRPYPYYCWKDFDKFEMVNRLPRAYFSNKVGLCNSLQQIQWFYETGVCSTQYPRTYNVSNKDEVEAFKDDFKLTACIGVLKWFLHKYKTEGECAVQAQDGKVDMNIIDFALRRCSEFVKTKQHEDIDIPENPTVWEYQWDQFITQYYKIINFGQKLKNNRDGIATKTVYLNVQSMLNVLKPYWPQFDVEGYQNFWIVKPGGRCCGAGIVIKNNLEQILLAINPNSLRETRFVVQKYIERPLLIYNTKFDIRQWFLVTNVYPLTIWMYKECYLRFCSQPFTLENTHESIHLCNNAVQRKYKNAKRDRGLPDENMWDCYTFQTYLKAIGHPEAWEKYIYPGMREGFIGALLASQDSMERKKNCFELYGADFMISSTITDGPWLIEINSNPAMDSSTSVTARMCPQVLEDIIKVVIDRRDNKSAPTGGFEMVYKQNCPPIPPYLGMTLCVKGKKAYKTLGDNKVVMKKSKNKKPCESLHYTDTEEESIVEEIISVTPCSENPDDCIKEESSDAAEADEASADSCSSQIRKDKELKRRKTDWVKKNIEDLKVIQSLNRPKVSLEPISEKSTPRKISLSDEDIINRNKILKLLGKVETDLLIQLQKKVKNEKTEDDKKFFLNIRELIIEGMGRSKTKEDSPTDDESSEKKKRKMDYVIELCRLSAEKKSSQLNELIKEVNEGFEINFKPSSKSCPNFDKTIQEELGNEEQEKEKSISEDSFKSFSEDTQNSKTNDEAPSEYYRDRESKLKNIQLDEFINDINDALETTSKSSRKSCPNFDIMFQQELETLEKEEAKTKSELSLKSCFAHNESTKSSKTSLEYYRDWKSKLYETRKICEDILNRLHEFNQESSKSKFQEAVKKRIKDETDFVKRIKQKKSNNNVKVKKEEKDLKLDDYRTSSKIWNTEGGLTPLAINSENGAVRNINHSLPKIKQRSRSLLPNGSSGHGRKIDVSLEETCCH